MKTYDVSLTNSLLVDARNEREAVKAAFEMLHMDTAVISEFIDNLEVSGVEEPDDYDMPGCSIRHPHRGRCKK